MVRDVDISAGSVECSMRTWWSERGEVDAAVNVSEGGHLSLSLPRGPSALLPAVPYAEVTRSLVDVIQRTSVVADVLVDHRYTSVADLLVPPRFYPAPYTELRAGNPSRGTDR